VRQSILALCLLAIVTVDASAAASSNDPAADRVWRKFLERLSRTGISRARMKPYMPELAEPMTLILRNLAPAAAAFAAARPEYHRVGDQLHVVVELPQDRGGTWCFSFDVSGATWYFQHVENIVLRLDRTGSPPVSHFPDITDDRKTWIREEMATTETVRLFNFLCESKGKDFAFDWFRDGRGYVLAARTWVPFVEPHRAFVLYACWELANLRRHPVTLERLTDEDARVRIRPLYFQLYQRTGHMRKQIDFADFRRLFETIWTDRATTAGWRCQIVYEGDDVVLQLSR